MNRKLKDGMLTGLIYGAIVVTLATLGFILAFIFYNGLPGISVDFLTSPVDDTKVYVTFAEGQEYNIDYEVITTEDEQVVEITAVEDAAAPVNNIGEAVELEEGQTITNIDDQKVKDMSEAEINAAMTEIENPSEDMYVGLVNPGGGILPLIQTTLYIIFFSVLFALPIGIFAAIFLTEYKVNPRIYKVIRFSIDSLAGIPSIIFGLFGYMFFGVTCGFGVSLLTGILTMTIMLLPIIIKTVEEALKTVPSSYREASLGLGASKSQTIIKVVVPTALPGIIVAIILSIGRVIGESAIFIFTAGTMANSPAMLDQGATLTVHAYMVTKEFNDIAQAASIGIVIITIIFILNMLAKFIAKKLTKGA